MIKVRNFQALIDNNYVHTQKDSEGPAQFEMASQSIQPVAEGGL